MHRLRFNRLGGLPRIERDDGFFIRKLKLKMFYLEPKYLYVTKLEYKKSKIMCSWH